MRPSRRTGLVLAVVALTVMSGPPALAAAGKELPSEPPTDWAGTAEYVIVPGDELRVDLGYNPLEGRSEFVTLVVRPDGRISVHPVGDLVAAGRTPAQVDSALTEGLRQQLRAPNVTVSLVKTVASQVHVLGRVEKPGTYPIDAYTSVVRAISLAGGFKDDAARNSVLLFHRAGPGEVRVARLAVDRMLKAARLDEDALLARYDIVYVPRSTIGNINLFVRQFFAEQGAALSTVLVGWELFNLDRVFVLTNTR